MKKITSIKLRGQEFDVFKMLIAVTFALALTIILTGYVGTLWEKTCEFDSNKIISTIQVAKATPGEILKIEDICFNDGDTITAKAYAIQAKLVGKDGNACIRFSGCPPQATCPNDSEATFNASNKNNFFVACGRSIDPICTFELPESEYFISGCTIYLNGKP